MIIVRIILFPFAVLYRIITGLRNYLYDRNLKPSVEFDLPVINVGNLTVGGTGKTPMIEHLIRLTDGKARVATLSRGYGRKTKGFRLATDTDTAETIGDEPMQFYRKYKQKITVAVGEERAFAIPNILQEREETEVIFLDDAFQHRQVKPSFNVLLSDYNNPFYTDYMLPSGRLREGRAGARRADAVVVTKCPAGLQDESMLAIEHSIRRYAGDKPVFFSTIRYGEIVSVGAARAFSDQIILVTGIANAAPLKQAVEQMGKILKHIALADHHTYSHADLETLKDLLRHHPDASILTTEKDMVKLVDPVFAQHVQVLPLFYVPIEVEFLKNGQDFDALILNAISETGR
jgi:tetraacyldisaccharide 4'-kinase